MLVRAAGRRGLFFLFLALDIAGEEIASPGNRANQVAVRAKRLAERVDLKGEVVLLHDHAWPDTIEQLILADGRPLCVDQRQQHLDCAGAKLNRRPVPEQPALTPQQAEPAEPDLPRSLHEGSFELTFELMYIRNGPFCAHPRDEKK